MHHRHWRISGLKRPAEWQTTLIPALKAQESVLDVSSHGLERDGSIIVAVAFNGPPGYRPKDNPAVRTYYQGRLRDALGCPQLTIDKI